MSFILDALKRADQDRALSAPTSLGAIYAPADEHVRSVSRSAWLLALLVATAAMLLLIWRLERGGDAPSAPLEDAPAATVTRRASPAAPVSVEPRPQPAPEVEPARPAMAAPRLRDLAPSAARVEPAPLRSLVSAEPAPAPTTRPQRPVRPRVVVADRPLDGSPAAAVPSAPTMPVADSSRAAAPVADPEREAAEFDSAPLLYELSAARQQEYSPLRLDAHVYSTDPARRFIILNGRRYREGQTTEADLLVLRIILDGVVFSHRDQTFRVLQ